MGVSIETAQRWEQNHKYQIPVVFAFPLASRKVVDHYFATARTKDWDTRLKEYWALQDYKLRDTEYHGNDQRTEFSDSNPNIDLAADLDTLSQVPEQAEEENLRSHQLRSTVEICRRTRRDEFHGFMDLPSEIRDMIYSYALHKGRVIIPNSGPFTRDLEPVKYYKNDDGFYYMRYRGLEHELAAMENGRRAPRPLGLVQGVSRAVQDEAARIYFGRNHFIFPAGSFLRPIWCNLRDGFERSTEDDFWRDARNHTNIAPLLRDVSYAFDMRDYPTDDFANLYRNFRIRDSIRSRAVSPGEALRALHDQKTLSLEIEWTERIDSIKRMTLDRLLLAFDECYCAVGCCRKVEWVLDRFLHEGPPPGTGDTADNAYSSIDWRERPPLVIEVIGLVNDWEKQMAQEKLTVFQGSEVCFNTTVAPEFEFMSGAGLVDYINFLQGDFSPAIYD